MSHPRVKLSTGASTAAKTVSSALAVIMLLIGGAAALAGYGLMQGGQTAITTSIPNDTSRADEPATDAEIAAGIAGAACGLIFLLIAVYLVVRVLRSGAWLQGSVLVVRGAVRTKKSDLSKARISGGTKLKSPNDPGGERVQVITVTDPDSGKSLTLSLRGSGAAMLPADQLRMLANAITNQRSRSGPDDQAFAVAEHLRKFASDPFS